MIIQTPVGLSKGRVVCKTASGIEYAQPTNSNQVIGFVTSSIPANSFVEIREKGVIDGFAGLTTGLSVYLTYSGTITQSIPTAGRLQSVGVAISSTKILIQIQMPIYLMTIIAFSTYFSNDYADQGYVE